MTNLQEKEPKPQLSARMLLENYYEYLRNLHAIQVVIHIFITMLMVMIFSGGIKTMATDVVHSFPIPDWMKFPIGFGLMLVLVLLAHLLTHDFVKVCFNWTKYTKAYRLLLPLALLFVVLFCFAVQTNSSDITTTSDMEQSIAELSIDSTNVWQIDQTIAQVNQSIQSNSNTIAKLEQTQSKRRSNWLSEPEHNRLATAQLSKQKAMEQLLQLTTQRKAETASIAQFIRQETQKLTAKRNRDLLKSTGRAGLCEILLIISSLFAYSFRHRHKVEEVRVETVETEIIPQSPFPERAPVQVKQQILPSLKATKYDEEKHILHLKDEIGEETIIQIMPLMTSLKTYRGYLDRNQRNQDTNLKNIQLHEQILAMTQLPLTDIEQHFNYQPLNIDYWNNTSPNVAQHVAPTLESTPDNAHQRHTTPSNAEEQLFGTH
jgi:hypothetical protein